MKKKSPPIEVFVRHCYYSKASFHKARFEKFSFEKCHQNLMQTADFTQANFTFFLDTHFGHELDHFIKKEKRFPLVEIDAGCEAKSFLALLEYVAKQSFPEETILYFLEDDYLHRTGWVDVLLEGFTLPAVDYITLFDDRDKYFLPQYQELSSQIFHTKTCHWRTTPSTTNTYAMRFKTFKEHLPIHQKFSIGRQISADYDKFCHLQEIGATLISSLPGWSTHVQPENASPCFDWESSCEAISLPKSGSFFQKILSK